MGQKMFGHLFLSAGAMKAGTTWLYSVMGRHPALYFTPEKEIHYFYHRYVDPGLLNEKRRLKEAKTKYLPRFDPETANVDRIRDNLHWVANYLSSPVDDFWYRNLFAAQRRETFGCDFSNLYALLPADAWARIHADCDKLRVLYTMRHPVKRLWSHLKFQLRLNDKMEVLETWAPADYASFARQPFLWDNAEYGRAVRNMKEGLPADSLKLIFYEDLHADQRGMLSEIEDFLSITHFKYPDAALNRRVNESAPRAMPDFFPGLFQDDVQRICDELTAEGLRIPDSWTVPLNS